MPLTDSKVSKSTTSRSGIDITSTAATATAADVPDMEDQTNISWLELIEATIEGIKEDINNMQPNRPAAKAKIEALSDAHLIVVDHAAHFIAEANLLPTIHRSIVAYQTLLERYAHIKVCMQKIAKNQLTNEWIFDITKALINLEKNNLIADIPAYPFSNFFIDVCVERIMRNDNNFQHGFRIVEKIEMCQFLIEQKVLTSALTTSVHACCNNLRDHCITYIMQDDQVLSSNNTLGTMQRVTRTLSLLQNAGDLFSNDEKEKLRARCATLLANLKPTEDEKAIAAENAEKTQLLKEFKELIAKKLKEADTSTATSMNELSIQDLFGYLRDFTTIDPTAKTSVAQANNDVITTKNQLNAILDEVVECGVEFKNCSDEERKTTLESKLETLLSSALAIWRELIGLRVHLRLITLQSAANPDVDTKSDAKTDLKLDAKLIGQFGGSVISAAAAQVTPPTAAAVAIPQPTSTAPQLGPG